ncbi:translational GTPase TypA [Desulfohalovibrio reitneri]|uniref:translational GTPase TypA n=1 Tax=Desulfohalovibrio reitneri TaxID=1307759 RepID=UPI0004A6EDB5|nr:translational GTPase TypA [Desulfohalovibrio reitneri]
MTTQVNEAIRNIAIIAHVDHGKTTLVDAMFKQSGVFREGKELDDRLMDSMDLERERGITIAAKNCSVMWNGVKINILDTPGHADFGGEVERALSMVDGAVLLVDASEGPLPQTRFVLKKTLDLGLRVVVAINKIDRHDARPDEVLQEIYDLFIELDADDEQIEFPVLYAIGRDGVASTELDNPKPDLAELFETILATIHAPRFDDEKPFQMLVSDQGYSDFLGRLAIGKIANGSAKSGQRLIRIGESGKHESLRVTRLQAYQGMELKPVDGAQPGDIVVLSGLDTVRIGDTITVEGGEALPRISVDEPTVSMRFTINTSPLSGLEGDLVTSAKIGERLRKESLANVAVQVEEDDEGFMVKGRGEFQMAILIETMRREGYELSVGRPEVILKTDGKGGLLEPMERLYVNCEEAFTGTVTEKLSLRKGRLMNLVNHGNGRVRLEFSVPSRGLIGYRDEFLTDTKGTGIMTSYFDGYDAHRGEFPTRHTGSIVSDRRGKAVPYALFNLEPRGTLFVQAGEDVYEGMIIGEHNRDSDLDVNPCKEKKLTNVRAAGRDENVVLTNVLPLTLERAIHFIRADEEVEVTPKSIRLRKAELSGSRRHTMRGAAKKATG